MRKTKLEHLVISIEHLAGIQGILEPIVCCSWSVVGTDELRDSLQQTQQLPLHL